MPRELSSAPSPGQSAAGAANEDTVGFRSHDHGVCIASVLQSAVEKCDAAGLRLTRTRRRVLEILLEEHRAMGAYDVLRRMQDEGLGSQPPAAYRALDFLVANGLAHRVEGLNAFVACMRPGSDHIPAFMHCRKCGTLAEAHVPAHFGFLEQAAGDVGFRVESTVIEAHGICAQCKQDDGGDSLSDLGSSPLVS